MRSLVSTAAAAAVGALLWAGIAGAATCSSTNYYRDGINMTAAVIVSGAGDISGQTINAGGCNIGIFYGPGSSGTVDSTEVFGANYFGVLVTGEMVDNSGNVTAVGAASVDLTNSKIHDIGEVPLNGTQHGVAVYYRAFAPGSSATGTISGDAIYAYQKGGIVVNGPGAGGSVSGNTVTGVGPTAQIAQNGIQIGYGATAQVMRNTVSENSYTGPNAASSGGIIAVGGSCYALLFGDLAHVSEYPLTTGTQIVKNTVQNNDVGAYLSNWSLDSTGQNCVPPTSATNVKVINNIISDDALTNTTGYGNGEPYQAGISDVGVNDKLINNQISGVGYQNSQDSTGAGTYSIDASAPYASKAKIHANSVP